jgi:NitT/TauT family transport system substrate-binding protein
MTSGRGTFRIADAALLTSLVFGSVLGGLASARAEDDVSVRLNWFAAGYSAPFYLGIEKGWYRDAGLNLTVQEGQGSGPTAQQVAAGRTTFGFISADAVTRVVAQGAPIKMVASLAEDAGYCALVKADSGIKSFKDLASKRYAATAYSSVGKLLPAVLKLANVPDDQVKRISVDAAGLHAGFIGNQFEAMEALTFDEPPHFDGEGIKTSCLSYSDAGVHVLGLGLVASLSDIQNKPDMVKRFVAATIRSYAYSYQHPEEAAVALKKMVPDSAKDVGVSVAQLKLFEKLQPKPLGSMKAEEWQTSVGYLKQYLGIENAPSDLSKYYSDEFLPK